MFATLVLSIAAATSILGPDGAGQRLQRRIDPLPFTAVTLRDPVFAPRVEVARTVTIPACFQQCAATGRLANFDRAAGLDATPFQGNCYDDSDVYKVIEGAAYSLAQHPDPALDDFLDRLIARIAAAQEADGYLYTIATANRRPPEARWKDERWSHETYCAGHLFEAAVAHYQATGKESLLDVARRFADLLVAEFLRGDRTGVPGHQEVEIGLARLYRVTKDEAYLDLARRFLERRGIAEGRELYGEYCQDHLPVAAQRTAVGHAVRAAYLYSAMADLDAIAGGDAFAAPLEAIWNDCVETKTHITGGIGAHSHNEGFGDAYDLPNESAYLETCAAIAQALWNHRMFLRSGSSKYLDLLERVLHNGVMSGVSLSGDRFFYPNPLACDGLRPFNHGSIGRAPWFGCACCPVNIARFLPSVSGLAYATSEALPATADAPAVPPAIWVNLLLASDAEIPLGDAAFTIRQRSDYPWSGALSFEIEPHGGVAAQRCELRVRIPGWAVDRPYPGSLYATLERSDADAAPPKIAVNGAVIDCPIVDGFAVIDRHWTKGDTVTLELPMAVRRMVARHEVIADRGRVAFERGPIVYCVEAADQVFAGGSARATMRDRFVPDDAPIAAVRRDELLGGVVTLLIDARRADGDAAPLVAIPYATWANRPTENSRGEWAVGEMAVWLPRNEATTEKVAPPSLANEAIPQASHTWASDTPGALHDRRLPSSRSDQSIPRHTWWNRVGTTEWVSYEWPKPITARRMSIALFDDTALGGGCALPKSWRLLARDGEEWKEVAGGAAVPETGVIEADFGPVTTTALRFEVVLQPGRSGGVLEWRVE